MHRIPWQTVFCSTDKDLLNTLRQKFFRSISQTEFADCSFQNKRVKSRGARLKLFVKTIRGVLKVDLIGGAL